MAFVVSFFVLNYSFLWCLGRAVFVIVTFPGYLHLYLLQFLVVCMSVIETMPLCLGIVYFYIAFSCWLGNTVLREVAFSGSLPLYFYLTVHAYWIT